MRIIHIERKTLPPDDVLRRALLATEKHRGTWIVPALISRETGLSLLDAEEALLTLSARHPSRLGVTEDGAISVFFEEALPSASPTLVERVASRLDRAAWFILLPIVSSILSLVGVFGISGWGALGEALASHVPSDSFANGFIMFLTVVPMIVGTLLLLVPIVGFLVWCAVPTLVVLPLWLAFQPFLQGLPPGTTLARHIGFSAVVCVILWAMAWALWSLLRRHVERRVMPIFRPLWASTFGFIFGTRTPVVDALYDEQRLLERLEELDGVATTADLMGLFGWDPPRAEREISRILLDYAGDILVSDDGSLVFVFPYFRASTPRAPIEELGGLEGPPRPVATGSRKRASAQGPVFRCAPAIAPRFFDCSRSFVWMIGALIVPGTIGVLITPGSDPFPAFSDIALLPEQNEASLGAWPALVFLAMLLARLPMHMRQLVAWRRSESYLSLLSVACEMPQGGPLPAGPHVAEFVARLDGKVDDTSVTGPQVSFPRIRDAFLAAARIRAGEPFAEGL